GALVGIAGGLAYGWAGAMTILGALGSVRLGAPWALIAVVAAVAIGAGLPGSVIPARAAAEAPPVAAPADGRHRAVRTGVSTPGCLHRPHRPQQRRWGRPVPPPSANLGACGNGYTWQRSRVPIPGASSNSVPRAGACPHPLR